MGASIAEHSWFGCHRKSAAQPPKYDKWDASVDPILG